MTGSAPAARRSAKRAAMSAMTSPRRSSSAALTLWKTTGTPMAAISSRTASAVAFDARMSRWTPTMPWPSRARARLGGGGGGVGGGGGGGDASGGGREHRQPGQPEGQGRKQDRHVDVDELP